MRENIAYERLADYLAGLLPNSDSDDLEEHLFSCDRCARESERLFGLAAAVHEVVPAALTLERFEELSRDGRIATVNPMSPGQVAEVRFPPEGKLLVHRLGGSDLTRARRVDVSFLDLEGKALARYDDVPFDRERGEVIIACQSHFADIYPHDGVLRVEVVGADEREEAGRYTVLHRL